MWTTLLSGKEWGLANGKHVLLAALSQVSCITQASGFTASDAGSPGTQTALLSHRVHQRWLKILNVHETGGEYN